MNPWKRSRAKWEHISMDVNGLIMDLDRFYWILPSKYDDSMDWLQGKLGGTMARDLETRAVYVSRHHLM